MIVLHPTDPRRTWLCTALALCLLLTGCSRYEPIADPVAQTNELIGYEVRVVTADGGVRRFVLRDITDSELVGDFHRVLLDEVAEVGRWHFDLGKTALLFAALAGLYLVPFLWSDWM